LRERNQEERSQGGRRRVEGGGNPRWSWTTNWMGEEVVVVVGVSLVEASMSPTCGGRGGHASSMRKWAFVRPVEKLGHVVPSDVP
jgi:hypothetical protein